MKINKRILIILVLAVFVTGMCISGVNATKNSDGTATLQFKVDSQGGAYNTIKLNKTQVKHLEKDNDRTPIKLKVAVETVPAKKKVVKVKVKNKVPVYKYKKVKTTKWVVKKVCHYETWYYSFGSWDSKSKSKSYSTKKYWNSKQWKYCGSSYKVCPDSYSYTNEFYDHTKYYTHFKKKVTGYKKIKYVHHYKTVYRWAKEYKFYGKKTVYKNCELLRMPFITDKGGMYALIGTTNGYNSFTIEFDKNFNYKTFYW